MEKIEHKRFKNIKPFETSLSEREKQSRRALFLAHQAFGKALADTLERAAAEKRVVVIFHDEVFISDACSEGEEGRGQKETEESSNGQD